MSDDFLAEYTCRSYVVAWHGNNMGQILSELQQALRDFFAEKSCRLYFDFSPLLDYIFPGPRHCERLRLSENRNHFTFVFGSCSGHSRFRSLPRFTRIRFLQSPATKRQGDGSVVDCCHRFHSVVVSCSDTS